MPQFTEFTTSHVNGDKVGFEMSGDLNVIPGVSVGSTAGLGVEDTQGGNTIENSGTIFGAYGAIADNVNGGAGLSTITNYGSIHSFAGTAIEVGGDHGIWNNKEIVADNGIGVITHGAGTLQNEGSISAGTHVAVWNQDNNAGDTVHTVNDGVITGHSSYYAATSHSVDDVQNRGTMNGDVWLSDGHGSTFNSFGGTLNGTVHCGAGGDNVTLGKTGGTVVSGAGADNLTANGTSGSTFTYDSFSESSHANNSVDHINDFRSGYDKIDLSAIVNNPNALPQYAVEITATDKTGDYKVTMNGYDHSHQFEIDVHSTSGGLHLSDFVVHH